LTLLA